MVSNLHNLPEPLVKALTPERRKPVPGRIGVTALIDSPLRRLLTMRHFDEIIEDASDSFWALIGKSVHYVIEQGDKNTEMKISQQAFGATIVGIVDYFKNGHIIDWKTTSVWSAVFSDGKDWEKQLQCYSYLLRSLGHPVDKLSVYMILRDWNKRESQKSPDTYPMIPFKAISYTPWDKMTVEAFVSERVSLHLLAEKVALASTSIEIPAEFWCTPAERWEKPTKYAAKSVGKDRAVRVFDTEEECSKFIFDTKMFLEVRPGEQTKCLSYCAVAQWCACFAKLKEAV